MLYKIPNFPFGERKESFNMNMSFYVYKKVRRIMLGNGILYWKIYTLQTEMH